MGENTPGENPRATRRPNIFQRSSTDCSWPVLKPKAGPGRKPGQNARYRRCPLQPGHRGRHLVRAYKPNLAFYEALGLPGMKALEKTILHIRDDSPKTIIIGDFKRGDVDSSTSGYVKAILDQWGFDAVTVNP